MDIRPTEEYRRLHIDGAVSWPFVGIVAAGPSDGIPKNLKSRILFFICDAGFDSARAAMHLRDLGHKNVYSVQGGYPEWIRGTAERTGVFYRMRTEGGATEPFPTRNSSLFEQLAVCAAAFVVKPAYMLMSFLLICWLWRQKTEDLLALKWSLVCFLAGEGFCAINYIFFGEASHGVEYLHIIGMAAAFSVFTYALFHALDIRILHIRSPKTKCAAHLLCRDCHKYTETTCGILQLLSVIIAGLLVLCAMPPLAGISTVSYNTKILGSVYTFIHPAVFQFFETMAAPAIAGLLFACSLIVFRKGSIRSIDSGVPLFCIGTGFLGFSLFRTILFGLFGDNLVWFVVWEEITELLFVTVTGAVLWIFRHRLLAGEYAAT